MIVTGRSGEYLYVRSPHRRLVFVRVSERYSRTVRHHAPPDVRAVINERPIAGNSRTDIFTSYHFTLYLIALTGGRPSNLSEMAISRSICAPQHGGEGSRLMLHAEASLKSHGSGVREFPRRRQMDTGSRPAYADSLSQTLKADHPKLLLLNPARSGRQPGPLNTVHWFVHRARPVPRDPTERLAAFVAHASTRGVTVDPSIVSFSEAAFGRP